MGALPGLCLATALASAFVPGQQFTLAWVHSIEKVRWEEDYRVAVGPGPAEGDAAGSSGQGRARLVATQARVRGSAAGMEPPPGAVLHGGWFAYAPQDRYPQELRLSRSEFVPDYELCVDKATSASTGDATSATAGPEAPDCRPLGHWLPSDGAVTTMKACLAPR